MCPECEERRRKARQAWLDRNILGVVEHVAKGAAEMVGVKRKEVTPTDVKPKTDYDDSNPVNRPEVPGEEQML